MTHYVYVLFSYDGVPFYVGKGVKDRWLNHEKEAFSTRSERGRNAWKFRIIRRTIAVLGEVPKVKIAENLTESAAFDLEIELIRIIGRRPDGPLVNVTRGGEGFTGRHSDATRKKIGKSLTGKIFTPERRANISAALTGDRWPDDRRQTWRKRWRELVAEGKQQPQPSQRGRRWINDGTVNKKLPSGVKVPPQGWVLGRLLNRTLDVPANRGV